MAAPLVAEASANRATRPGTAAAGACHMASWRDGAGDDVMGAGGGGFQGYLRAHADVCDLGLVPGSPGVVRVPVMAEGRFICPGSVNRQAVRDPGRTPAESIRVPVRDDDRTRWLEPERVQRLVSATAGGGWNLRPSRAERMSTGQHPCADPPDGGGLGQGQGGGQVRAACRAAGRSGRQRANGTAQCGRIGQGKAAQQPGNQPCVETVPAPVASTAVSRGRPRR
jgi:hypothetical protein